MSENLENQNNAKAFDEALAFINQYSNFLLATHARTDGDDLGSMLAIVQMLHSKDKVAQPLALGGVPRALRFLPGQNWVLEGVPKDKNFDAVILFGCGNKERTGIPEIINTQLPVLNIDHHHDNAGFGTVNLVDEKKSSVAELIFDFFKYINFSMNGDASKCLLTGIFTDTGSFMHSNTKPSTLSAASELMKYGARIDKIHSLTYANKNAKSLKAWSRALENTRIEDKNNIAISVMTEEDLNEVGPLEMGTFDGFVETLNKIPNTRFALFLKQDGDMVKGSLRSEERKNVDVSEIARTLGGGGHKLAAGFEVKGKIKKLPDGGWVVEEN